MPKQTFFHLPKDKQDTLIQAAKKEFSRVPLHEASIANIIKDAAIPRGSFYQYFEGKEDLYYYLLNQLSQKNNDRFIATLKEKNGDIFEAFIDSFQFMTQYHGNQEHKNFFKNAFLNMNYKMENTLANNIYEESQKNQYLTMISLMNTKNLNIKEERELHHIIKIFMAVTFQNLVQMFVRDLTDEEALKNYIEQMEMLKRGIYKGEH
ncbi:TetR/AcrR family transcriptional regulator [Neobacillus vireti]|uniref:TetR family transcriptional regulator n=1 Tax=Neobacillus vireti LMG 21834 TaxID=1131730 RepID=A0AB94IFG5_9BACI|nr:TetR family transcriptional regulator [Neobacillus vireti]ETI65853.1 TetR family transcriptional regulator [Neobacillus vireti LMG 21834]KLT18110.1 TetR family transcriptional regulator [Neobacillus vireti]